MNKVKDKIFKLNEVDKIIENFSDEFISYFNCEKEDIKSNLEKYSNENNITIYDAICNILKDNYYINIDYENGIVMYFLEKHELDLKMGINDEIIKLLSVYDIRMDSKYNDNKLGYVIDLLNSLKLSLSIIFNIKNRELNMNEIDDLYKHMISPERVYKYLTVLTEFLKLNNNQDLVEPI